MINALLQIALSGCAHRRTTFPLTPRRKLDHTYVVCLNCGTEFEYDWKAMRMGAPVRPSGVVAFQQPEALIGTAR